MLFALAEDEPDRDAVPELVPVAVERAVCSRECTKKSQTNRGAAAEGAWSMVAVDLFIIQTTVTHPGLLRELQVASLICERVSGSRR